MHMRGMGTIGGKGDREAARFKDSTSMKRMVVYKNVHIKEVHTKSRCFNELWAKKAATSDEFTIEATEQLHTGAGTMMSSKYRQYPTILKRDWTALEAAKSTSAIMHSAVFATSEECLRPIPVPRIARNKKSGNSSEVMC
jgi:hypothetical protein